MKKPAAKKQRPPVTRARLRRLLAAGRQLPEQTPADATAVASAVRKVRSARGRRSDLEWLMATAQCPAIERDKTPFAWQPETENPAKPSP